MCLKMTTVPGSGISCDGLLVAAHKQTTEGPMWGHLMLVLGALCSFLEPFRGCLSPNIDNVPEKLTLRYPHEGPWVVSGNSGFSGCPCALHPEP